MNGASNSGFHDRFEVMWNDLIESPIKHTLRYKNTSEMFKEVDAEIDRLRNERDGLYRANVNLALRLSQPPSDAQLDEHDAGIIKDLEAMAADRHSGFWPRALAIGALRLIRRPAPTKDAPRYPTQAECTEIAAILQRQRAEGAGWDGNGSPVGPPMSVPVHGMDGMTVGEFIREVRENTNWPGPTAETPASPCGHVPAQYGCPVCDRH